MGERGFIHGTGHGLGQDLHERPYLKSASQEVLKVGHVVSVEPGLYYSELGGVRVENAVLVTQDGYRNLTNYFKELQEF